MYIIFMGPPGAGKGTQAERVAGELKLEHLAPGDLFRQAVKQESDLGNEVQGYMERGELVPDEITIRIILDKLDDIGDEKG
ncbi:MAG: nucleoside monophosphate kinase, partial [Dehalococcoidales bacterium]